MGAALGTDGTEGSTARVSTSGVIGAGRSFGGGGSSNSRQTQPTDQQLPGPKHRWEGVKLPCHLNPLQGCIQERGRENRAETKGSFITKEGLRRPPPAHPPPAHPPLLHTQHWEDEAGKKRMSAVCTLGCSMTKSPRHTVQPILILNGFPPYIDHSKK